MHTDSCWGQVDSGYITVQCSRGLTCHWAKRYARESLQPTAGSHGNFMLERAVNHILTNDLYPPAEITAATCVTLMCEWMVWWPGVWPPAAAWGVYAGEAVLHRQQEGVCSEVQLLSMSLLNQLFLMSQTLNSKQYFCVGEKNKSESELVWIQSQG